MKLTVNLGKNSYPIYIENNILDKASSYISSCFSGKKIMIISDDNVFPLYGEKLKTSLGDYEVHELVLPHGEPTKAFETLPALYNALLKQKFSRSDLVIALGGGVIGDLAGFAACLLFKRDPFRADSDFPACTGGFFRWRKGCGRSPAGKKPGRSFLSPKTGTDRSSGSSHSS